ncbi:MAG: DUF4935 domain-containing protein [Undibacterium sp.]|nr:DUF4935 domain-containing protein [Opitutaceae bacterium]
MSYTPLTLYIDTEVFKRNDLRFSTKEFQALISEFRPQALRILVPLMMERELKRHFSRRAKECAKHIKDALNKHPFDTLSTKIALSPAQIEADCEAELNSQWEKFKSHFKAESLPLAGDMETISHWYFSEIAPFSEKKPREFPDAFILSAIDDYQKKNKVRIAVVGHDGDFIKACTSRKHLVHFSRIEDYISKIKSALAPNISTQDEASEKLNLSATENLDEIRAIVTLGIGATELEISRLTAILRQRGESYQYFFNTVTDPFWIPFLISADLFDNISDVETQSDGARRFPLWPPAQYLWNVCERDRDAVFKIISNLPPTQNPQVLSSLIATIIKLDHPNSISIFNETIKAFLNEPHWRSDIVIRLLKWPQFSESINSAQTIALFINIVEFKSGIDGKAAAPRFEQWSYCDVLNQGVRHLAQEKPYETGRLLIDAVASMVRLRHAYGDGSDFLKDYSEVWCRKLAGPVENETTDAALVHVLTDACEKLYRDKPEYIQPLDAALRAHSISIFERLREHLYSEFTSEQLNPWIRELILAYPYYHKWEYHYELQKMIHRACDLWGNSLLSEAEKTTIFDAIISGPSEPESRQAMGSYFSEDTFQKRIDYFHRKQLQPFSPILFGKYRERFDALSEQADGTISDEDYSPTGIAQSGFVSYRSPQSIEELAVLSDEQLLEYINDWENSLRDPKNWLIEINISALASAFETVLRSKVLLESTRAEFWFKNRERIARPIYVRFLIRAVSEETKNNNFLYLSEIFDLCQWVLTKPGEIDEDDRTDRPHEESSDRPAWNPVRRGVIDFLEICVSKDANTPLSYRKKIADLLRLICVQRDSRLDDGVTTILNRRDPLSDAINNPRGIALEAVIGLGFWIRRSIPDDPVSEVGDILDQRLMVVDRLPITFAEYALFGRQFPNLITLDAAWASKHRALLFPRANKQAWTDAFRTYIRFNNPYKRPFELLREDYAYALDQFDSQSNEDGNRDWVDSLGQHLFMFYLWGLYPLKGEGSMLEMFYNRTRSQPKKWAALFDHIGRLLRNAQEEVEESIKNRITSFANWRIAEGNKEELSAYTFWLDAKCLNISWRLKTFSEILDISAGRDVGIGIKLNSLVESLPANRDLVVECFSKLIRGLEKEDYIYLQTDKVKPILRAGLFSVNDSTRVLAEQAREHLLREARFEFLDLDTPGD